jgi:hypothetical protein
LFATGDITAQQLVEKKGLEKHELARTGRMFLYGGGMSCSFVTLLFVMEPSSPPTLLSLSLSLSLSWLSRVISPHLTTTTPPAIARF